MSQLQQELRKSKGLHLIDNEKAKEVLKKAQEKLIQQKNKQIGLGIRWI